MVASEYVKHRGMKELKSVLRNAKRKTGQQVRVVTTDGLIIVWYFGPCPKNKWFSEQGEICGLNFCQPFN